MDLLNIGLNSPYFIVEINLYVFGVIAIIILIIYSKTINNFFKISTDIEIEGASIGIQDSNIKLKVNQKDKEIAYKLWVELSTRKIGIPINMEEDTITELYDSWYEFFKISRETLKEFPPSKLNNKENDIIRINIQVLNDALRPHLTKWQSKYRHWYSYEIREEKDNRHTPQKIQKRYPEYEELIKDLQDTNKKLIKYREILYEIVFENENKIIKSRYLK